MSTTYKTKEEDFVFFFCFVLVDLLACCARALVNKNKTKEEDSTLRNSFPDDSGSKLRDKEQQRLSSK